MLIFLLMSKSSSSPKVIPGKQIVQQLKKKLKADSSLISTQILSIETVGKLSEKLKVPYNSLTILNLNLIL